MKFVKGTQVRNIETGKIYTVAFEDLGLVALKNEQGKLLSIDTWYPGGGVNHKVVDSYKLVKETV